MRRRAERRDGANRDADLETEDPFVGDVLDGSFVFAGVAGHGVADSGPRPVIAEDGIAGGDERGVIEKVLINVFFLVTAIDVNEVGAEVGAEEPECGGCGGKGKRGDARGVAGVADVGEEAVIDGGVAVFAFEREEAVLVGLVALELECA